MLVTATCGSSPDNLPPTAELDAKRTRESAVEATLPGATNPFLRGAFTPPETKCVTARLLVDRTAGTELQVGLTNTCDHPMAVLTAPLEVRIRTTGREPMSNEKMARSPYAIVYAVKRGLGKEAFRGDGIARDGGLPVRRPPEFVTVPAGEKRTVALKCTGQDFPPGHDVYVVTYAAEQEAEIVAAGEFACNTSVAVFNGDSVAQRLVVRSDAEIVHSSAALLP